jgi:protoporphyrin/coproporphyrin ferrochelatase
MNAATTEPQKTGLLLVNLGTPDGTDYWSMRRYLMEFLSDRRVIEVNPVQWWFILNGPILTFRPGRSGKAYQAIWNRELDESPLRTITRSQADKLYADMSGTDGQLVIDWAMRYGNPSIASRLEILQSQSCSRILIFPLYPQYSASTTASVNDKVFDALKTMRWQPAIRTVPAYADDPVYIAALANSIETSLATLDFEPEIILTSFHGLPQSYVAKGDPYQRHCTATADALREKTGLGDKLRLTFQSRFGKQEWIQPYTDKAIEELARAGTKNLAIVAPGFAADCLETLHELAIENADKFKACGGEKFAYLPCLNDGPDGMAVIRHIATRELSGWIE